MNKQASKRPRTRPFIKPKKSYPWGQDFQIVNAVIMIIICLVIVCPHLLRGNRFHHGSGNRQLRQAVVLSGKLYLNGYKTTLSYTPVDSL